MAESALALDPLSPYVNTCVALNLITQGMYSEATEALSRALEMEPDFLYTLWVLGGTRSRREAFGETEKALDWAEKACEEKSPPMAMHQGTLLGDLRSEPRFHDVRRRMALDP